MNAIPGAISSPASSFSGELPGSNLGLPSPGEASLTQEAQPLEGIRTSGSLPTQDWGSTNRTTTIASCKPAHSGGSASECTYPELNPNNYEPGRGEDKEHPACQTGEHSENVYRVPTVGRRVESSESMLSEQVAQSSVLRLSSPVYIPPSMISQLYKDQRAAPI